MNTKALAQLKKIVLLAKNAYYNKDTFAKIPTEKLLPEVASLIKYGKVVDGKVVAPKTPKVVTVSVLEINDARYDLIEDAIKQADASWTPTTGAKVVGKFKVTLPYPMSSLNKIRPSEGTVSKFATKRKGPYVVSDKLDGVSIEVLFSKSGDTKAYTRGDGVTGQDISFLVPHLGLPEVKQDLPVRGEVIMGKAQFAKFSDEFKNARNLASGILNRKGVHHAIEHVDVIFYNTLTPKGSLSTELAKLKKLGLNVVPHTVVASISDASLSKILKARRAKSKYEIDGLVVAQDAKNLPTADNPDYAVAFKEDSEGNLAQARVESVFWEASKHGFLKPVLQIEPVELAGVTVKNVTAFNAKFIVDNKIGPGAIVEVTRSGEVIPKVVRVIKSSKAQLPSKTLGSYSWNKTGVDLVLDDTTQHSGIAVKQITAFLAEGLGVEHLAAGMVTKCFDAGIDSIEKFLRAKPATFLKVAGVKELSANKFYKQISDRCKNADLAKVAANSGRFGRNMGSRRVQAIIDKYDLFKLSDLSVPKIAAKVAQIEGFSDITANQFAEGLPKFAEWIKKQPITFASKKAASGSKLSGQSICFTGVRDKAAEQFIADQGGKVASGVTGTTTMLVVKDRNSGSSKEEKAAQLKLPIYTLVEFKKKFGV